MVTCFGDKCYTYSGLYRIQEEAPHSQGDVGHGGHSGEGGMVGDEVLLKEDVDEVLMMALEGGVLKKGSHAGRLC